MHRTAISLIVTLALLLMLPSLAQAKRKPTQTERDTAKLAVLIAALQGGFDATGEDLERTALAASETGLTGKEAKGLLSQLCSNHKEFAIDCAFIDADGIMVSVEPISWKREVGHNIGGQKHFQRLQATKKPVMSHVFFAKEGMPAIAYQWPIFDAKQNWIGAVSLLLKPERYIKQIVRPQLSGTLYICWIIQEDGKLIYGRDKKLIGRNLLTDPYFQKMTDLLALSKRIVKNHSGTGTYQTLGTAATHGFSTEHRARWNTIDVQGTTWRVVLAAKIP